MGEVKEKPDRVDETSDQLTGPIFIRMLLISILTYEHIHQLNLEDRNKSSGKKLDENSNIESNSPQQSEITSASTSLMTGEEEKAIQVCKFYWFRTLCPLKVDWLVFLSKSFAS